MPRTIVFLLLLLPLFVRAQGDAFPAFSGETPDGTKVDLPMKGTGYTIIGMAYGKQAGPILEEWYEPAYLRFVAGHGLFASQYDAQVWFVPMFVGINKAAYEPTMRKVRKGEAPEVADRIVFYKGELAPFQDALGMDRKDIPYIFVLDGQGRIVYRTEGSFTDDKLHAIEDILME